MWRFKNFIHKVKKFVHTLLESRFVISASCCSIEWNIEQCEPGLAMQKHCHCTTLHSQQ